MKRKDVSECNPVLRRKVGVPRLLFGRVLRTFVLVFCTAASAFLLRLIIHAFHQPLHTRVLDFLLYSPLLVTACTISSALLHIIYTAFLIQPNTFVYSMIFFLFCIRTILFCNFCRGWKFYSCIVLYLMVLPLTSEHSLRNFFRSIRFALTF